MRKGFIMKKFLGLVGLASVGLVTSASAVPIAAPDTSDITGTIIAFGGAAIAVWLAYIIFPIAIKVLKGLFR